MNERDLEGRKEEIFGSKDAFFPNKSVGGKVIGSLNGLSVLGKDSTPGIRLKSEHDQEGGSKHISRV